MSNTRGQGPMRRRTSALVQPLSSRTAGLGLSSRLHPGLRPRIFMRSSAAQAFCLASGLSAANRSFEGECGQLGFLGVERIGVFERCGRVGQQVVELRAGRVQALRSGISGGRAARCRGSRRGVSDHALWRHRARLRAEVASSSSALMSVVREGTARRSMSMSCISEREARTSTPLMDAPIGSHWAAPRSLPR